MATPAESRILAAMVAITLVVLVTVSAQPQPEAAERRVAVARGAELLVAPAARAEPVRSGMRHTALVAVGVAN